MAKIISYVTCKECRCSIYTWEVYAWHVDQGHTLIWPSMVER